MGTQSKSLMKHVAGLRKDPAAMDHVELRRKTLQENISRAGGRYPFEDGRVTGSAYKYRESFCTLGELHNADWRFRKPGAARLGSLVDSEILAGDCGAARTNNKMELPCR
jgi:hypothetical protein